MSQLTDLSAYLAAPPHRQLRRPAKPGVTVLIPTYSRPADANGQLLDAALDSVRLATIRAGVPVSVLIVDNGLTNAAAARLTARLDADPQLPYAIVQHHRVPGPRYQAAQARNVGLAALTEEFIELRREFLLFLDDDCELHPDALRLLMDCLNQRPRCVAAFATVARSAGEVQCAAAGGRPARPVPGPWWPDGSFAFTSVIAYGSSITARALGLLVRAEAVPSFFEGTPMGSCEDILFSALLLRSGEIWSVPTAVLLDRPRSAPGDVRRQRLPWGYDHAWLFQQLRGCGLVPAGLHRLDWDRAGGDWLYSCSSHGSTDGVIVNTDEVRYALKLVADGCSDPVRRQALFGDLADSVAAGVEQLVEVVTAAPVIGSAGVRLDLPPLTDRDFESLSTGLDSLIGQIAGNVAGSFDHHTFMAGVRQSGDNHDAEEEATS